MRRPNCEEGATLVEFAVSSAVLFSFLFGIFACCFAVYSYNFVSEAAKDGARYAMVRGHKCTGFSDCPDITSAQVQTYVKGLNYPGINSGNLTASASWSGSNSPTESPGNTVTVTVTYNYPLRIPLWNQTGRNLQMVSSSQMVISQ